MPVGADYDLQVSISTRTSSGFVFSPEPVSESESEQGSAKGYQEILQSAFYSFYDELVGNTWAKCATCAIDWQTPYARIQGSGDGTLDVFGFKVTSGMLNPTAAATDAVSGTAAAGPFYSSVSFALNGRITAGDEWTVGLRFKDYSYKVKPTDTTFSQIADGLAQDIITKGGGRYTVNVLDGTLTISDANGFNLKGLTLDSLSQRATNAATITRSQQALTTSGTAVSFLSATVALGGTGKLGETWSLVVGGTSHDVNATDQESAASLTQRLVNATPGATLEAGKIKVTSTTGATVELRVRGFSPEGTAVIDGTPVASQSGVGQAGIIQWSEARVALPAQANLRPGERWTVE